MSYATRGALLVAGIFIVLAIVAAAKLIDRNGNYETVQARVILVERQCKFWKEYGDKHREAEEEACDITDEFDSIATAAKRPKDVAGTAIVTVGYTAPQDGAYRTTEVQFDGRDEEFYKLEPGDFIDVRVNNEDPTKVILG